MRENARQTTGTQPAGLRLGLHICTHFTSTQRSAAITDHNRSTKKQTKSTATGLVHHHGDPLFSSEPSSWDVFSLAGDNEPPPGSSQPQMCTSVQLVLTGFDPLDGVFPSSPICRPCVKTSDQSSRYLLTSTHQRPLSELHRVTHQIRL